MLICYDMSIIVVTIKGLSAKSEHVARLSTQVPMSAFYEKYSAHKALQTHHEELF